MGIEKGNIKRSNYKETCTFLALRSGETRISKVKDDQSKSDERNDSPDHLRPDRDDISASGRDAIKWRRRLALGKPAYNAQDFTYRSGGFRDFDSWDRGVRRSSNLWRSN